MGLYLYRGCITADILPPRVYVGRRSGFLVVEIRMGKGEQPLLLSDLQIYPVCGLLLFFPKRIELNTAREMMGAADDAAYEAEFRRINQG